MNKTICKALLGLVILTSTGPACAGEGQLDQDLIRRVVQAHTPEVHKCYEKVLERDPAAKGVVVVDFTIGVQGKVTSTAVVANDIEDAALLPCMRTAIEGWLFPRPEGGEVEVSYPFLLLPG